MKVEWSLRKKLVYTVLAASLLTVLLFSGFIKLIINDYFDRQSAARLTFVREEGTQQVRANLAIFKDRLQNSIGGTAALRSVSSTGILGDRLPRTQAERNEVARILQTIQSEAKLSLITVLGLDKRVVVRATNPTVYGDDAFAQDYEVQAGPVTSIRNLVEQALEGKTIRSFAVFPPHILMSENAIEDGKVVSSLKDYAAVPLKSSTGTEVPPNSFEYRALTLTVAAPVLNSQGKVVGALVAGKILNNDIQMVENLRDLLQDHATIFLGQVRITTTLRYTGGENNGQTWTGMIHRDAERVSGGEYIERQSRIDGGTMGVFDPIRDHQNIPVGSLWLGRPLSLMDSIAAAQQEIDMAVERRTTIYIFALALVSVLISIGVASVFSKRVTRRIDQLRRGAAVIEQGQLDHRLQIDSGDEIELLSKQFNSMASKLEESHNNLERKVEERTRELQKSQEAMIQQEKMVGIGQLAAGIAHELNTPLGTIIGYAQMLREDLSQHPTGPANRGDVDEIIGQAGRCRDLVKNLLNFSRRSTTEKSNSNLNGIIRKIISLIEHDFEMKQVRIHLDLDPDLPPAKVNENEIAQVILNLANNAADSMPTGGDLYVSTNYNADFDRIRIDVHDTGCGIQESDRNRIFEPFFTTKEVGKGTGLGLSICYKIVENHLGTMEFDTATGQGTTFRVYLPVNAEVRVG